MDDPQLKFFEIPQLRRPEAQRRLERLIGQDLRPLAQQHRVTVWKQGRLNKGWAGQTVECFLGRRPNSKQAPDFGDWELKVVSLSLSAGERLRVKESMGITMFKERDLEWEFEESHLLEKLNSLLILARLSEDASESHSYVLAVANFDLKEPSLYEQIKEDYEEIRWLVRSQGMQALSGRVGQLIHPRPKGSAGSQGMGFYARRIFVEQILGLEEL